MILHNDYYFDSQMIIIIISYAREEEKILGGCIGGDDDKFSGMKLGTSFSSTRNISRNLCARYLGQQRPIKNLHFSQLKISS